MLKCEVERESQNIKVCMSVVLDVHMSPIICDDTTMLKFVGIVLCRSQGALTYCL